MTNVLVETVGLKKHFEVDGKSRNPFRKRKVHAVDGVDLKIMEGETLGLVGESGCGKTTLGRVILRLLEPTEGKITFDSVDITRLKSNAMKKFRRHMQIIFQDPFSSLDPRMTVGDIIAEAFDRFPVPGGVGKKAKVSELLEAVGLEPEHMNQLPHEFSGGQRQRIAIARALALNPKFIVADEPVSSLDVSIRAQVLNLMKSLKEKFNLTYLYISHDLSTTKFMSQDIAVMYLGKIVEKGSAKVVFNNPRHPYAEVLMSSIPIPDPKLRRERILPRGETASSLSLPSGCRFHPRCSIAIAGRCEVAEPDLVEIERAHFVACHAADS